MPFEGTLASLPKRRPLALADGVGRFLGGVTRLLVTSLLVAGVASFFDVDFDDEDQAAFMVLGFGPRIDVVAPETLRLRIARDVAAAFSRQAQPMLT